VGDAAVESGDWQQGLAAHQHLLAVDPSNCLAMFHLGYIWGKLEDHQKEIDFYQRAVACGYNQDDRLYFNLGMAHVAMGQMEAALDALERAVGVGPANADNHFGLGLVAGKAGFIQRAATAMEKAVALDPLHHEARVALIRLYLDHSRWRDARRHLVALEQKDPQNIELPELWETLHRRWME
jgi:tetratricopeptide (TPR) repeat protein